MIGVYIYEELVQKLWKINYNYSAKYLIMIETQYKKQGYIEVWAKLF